MSAGNALDEHVAGCNERDEHLLDDL